MASHEIAVAVTGDTSDYDKALGNAKKASAGFADDVESQTKRTGASFDQVGDHADNAETRITGLKDTVEGVSAVMKGPGEQGIGAYIQGWADLASGIANFAVPALSKVAGGLIEQGIEMAKAAAATVVAVGEQVAQWVIMGAQATAQAARVAAAWIISIGPIVLVAAAVVGLVILIVKNWDTIVDATKAAFDFVVDIIRGVIDWVRDNWPLILAIITGPIGLAVLTISRHWDDIKEVFRKGVEFVEQTFAKVYDFLVEPFRKAFEKVKELFDNTIGKLKIPDWVPFVGSGKSAPTGGGGALAATPLGLARFGAFAAPRAAPSTTKVSINVTTTGLGADAPAIQRAVANALRGYTARNGPLDIPVRTT